MLGVFAKAGLHPAGPQAGACAEGWPSYLPEAAMRVLAIVSFSLAARGTARVYFAGAGSRG